MLLTSEPYGWATFVPKTGKGPAHAVPLSDIRVHDITPGVVCWCSPDMDEDPIIHISADGREAFEEGRRRPS